MKTKQYLFGTILFCATAAFVSCSSSEEDNIITPVQPDEGLTTITVGSPTIVQDGADTRMTFAYDSGLKMEWEANDAIQIAGYNSSNSYKRSFTADYKAKTAGSSSTFEKISGSPTTTGHYNIGYLKGKTFSDQSGSGYARDYTSFGGDDNDGYTTWQSSLTFSTTQTQAGNNNTAHLKNNYVCLLQNVNAYDSPNFSTTWAESHDGNFYQSACLKFDLTLPEDYKGKTITSLTFACGGSTNWVKTTYSAESATTNTLTLNFSDVTLGDDCKLVGYFMMGLADQTLPSGKAFYVKVYISGLSDSKKYIQRSLSVGASDKTIHAGKLAIVKLNNSSWSEK